MIDSAVGPYRILGKLGAGGMGEVYRARDAKLQRDVAVKVLPDTFVADPERLARFEREAQALGALNHPNIAQVFGVIEHPPALVMELVEGRGLDAIIQDPAQQGAGLPMAMVLDIAAQIADAVDAAHERGIIHRDLKPANIKVRDDGTVKVLDFGLAKAIQPFGDTGQGRAPASVENSPTFTSPLVATQMGVILGTAAYMAPEQARGRMVDRRVDVWAFGCVLYEMLTGRRPFGGDDVTMTLAAIVKDPVDYSALPPDTPESVRRLLRRCLEKDPRKRQSSMGDARLDLRDAIAEPSPATTPSPITPSSRRPLLWALAGAVAGALLILAITWRPAPPLEQRVVRSTIAFKTPLRLSGNRALALNPAGTEMVLAGYGDAETFSLYRRRLDADVTTPIPGTEGAQGPFFSADGQWLGFVQNGRLKKMPAAGGSSVDLAEASGMQGGTFTPDGSIIFNPQHGEGLMRIAAGSTEPKPLTTVDRTKSEAGHHWPHLLPDGKHLLFTIERDGKPYSEAKIMLLPLDGGESRLLIDGGTDARYLPTGHIVFWRDDAVWRVPFDRNRLEITGNAEAVLPDVMAGQPNGQAHFAVSDNGTLVYLTGRDVQEERGLMLVDRAGVARQLGNRRAFETVAVSPDGTRVAVTIIAANDSLWTTEIDRPSFTRVTFEAESAQPVWSADGNRLVLTRHRGGEPRQLYIMPADGSTAPELLHESSRSEVPSSWTPHGNLLAFTRQEASGFDIWVMDMDRREATPLIATRFTEVHGRFSPDGKWLAYASDESGRFEVYVRPYPGPGSKRLVSSAGGTEPRWRGDGREIFYRIGDAVMAADVTTDGQFRSSIPRQLFKGQYRAEVNWPTWDALPNGKGFFVIQEFGEPRTSVHLVQNWFHSFR